MTNRTFMTVEEVAAELGVSKSYAYKIVKQLNEELQKLGYLTVAGRVNIELHQAAKSGHIPYPLQQFPIPHRRGYV